MDDREPAGEVYHLVREFEKNSQRLPERDLNRYPTLGDLRAAIESVGTSRRQVRQLAKGDSDSLGEVVTEDGRTIKIIVPKTPEASCAYGAGTKWCIAATKSRNYFSDYSGRNVVFYFLFDPKAKDESMRKVAIAARRGEIYAHHDSDVHLELFNALDQPIYWQDFEKEWGRSVLHQIQAIVEKDAEERAETAESKLASLSDVETIRTMVQAGQNLDVLAANPNLPVDSLLEIIRSGKLSDDSFVERGVFSRIAGEQALPVLRALLERKYFESAEELLKDLTARGQEFSIPDELFYHEVMSRHELLAALAEWLTLTPEQEDFLASIVDDDIIHILLSRYERGATASVLRMIKRNWENLMETPGCPSKVVQIATKEREFGLAKAAFDRMGPSSQKIFKEEALVFFIKESIDLYHLREIGVRFTLFDLEQCFTPATAKYYGYSDRRDHLIGMVWNKLQKLGLTAE